MFADHWDQFVLVSERNTPGVWLRSSRLFGARRDLRVVFAFWVPGSVYRDG